MQEPDSVLTVEQAAAILKISRGTAYEAVRTGEIPSVRIGRCIRVPRAALERLLEKGGER
jgi:excisionase family DNA binding protein